MNSNENVDRIEILNLVRKYYCNHKKNSHEFTAGDRIPYAGRIFDENEICNLVESALDFWLTAGDYCDEFENELSRFLNVKFSYFVNSGSSANLLAFMALTSPLLGERQILPGDEIITVAAGFPTTVTPIIQYGAIPVFVDIEIPEYNIDPDLIEKAISEKTKAIMVAHTLGNPIDLQRITNICKNRNIWLIEDNCDSLGSKIFFNGIWQYTGTIGDIGTSSFYPPHHITTGEGGAVYTNNSLLAKIVKSLRDWGRDCSCPSGIDNYCGHRFDKQYGDLPYGYDHKYVYSHFGYNLKATEMQASVGCIQLKKLPKFIEMRINNWNRLYNGLKDLQDYIILPKPAENSIPSWFGFLMTLKNNDTFNRNDLVQYLENNGIQTRMLFASNIIRHPCFNDLKNKGAGYRVVGSLNNTDTVLFNSFWIGVYPGLSEKMIEYMIKTIKNYFIKA